MTAPSTMSRVPTSRAVASRKASRNSPTLRAVESTKAPIRTASPRLPAPPRPESVPVTITVTPSVASSPKLRASAGPKPGRWAYGTFHTPLNAFIAAVATPRAPQRLISSKNAAARMRSSVMRSLAMQTP